MNAEFHLNGKVLETKRLILRPFSLDDVDDLYEYAKVEGVGEMAGWHYHEDRSVSEMIATMFVEADNTFAICLKENGKVIGTVGVENCERPGSFPELEKAKGREIGFVLSKAYWGRGLMPEAVTAVIDYLFTECDLDFLTCGYYDFNDQSKRVQEKLGFTFYRKMEMKTAMGTHKPGVLNLLWNPKKKVSG